MNELFKRSYYVQLVFVVMTQTGKSMIATVSLETILISISVNIIQNSRWRNRTSKRH